jgi:hypothetical protein
MQTMAPPPRRKRISRILALLGLLFLIYVLGAGAMFFELPSSGFLSRAFLGARAWKERSEMPEVLPVEQTPPAAIGAIDKPDKTFDGFTLYTCSSMSVPANQAFLVNMRGDVVHRWHIPFGRVWPNPPHIDTPFQESQVCFFATHLYGNGDLLVVFHGQQDWLNGFGLVKLDKDSNVLWKYAGNVHHDVDVAEDGTIYTLVHQVVHDMPEGLKRIPTPCLAEYLVLLSPEGKELKKPISILEMLRDSAYAANLAVLGPSNKPPTSEGANLPNALDSFRARDPLHANSVKVLSRRLAPRFPPLKAGHALLTLRNLDLLVAVDPEKEAVVWAGHGPWLGEHDAQFLDNGRLLIFDNLGSSRSSRVLEYDPRTQAIPWSYPGDDNPAFLTIDRGMSQRLPNGNTLIVHSQGGEMLEVTAEREIVWTCSAGRYIASARRYAPGQLSFLKGDARARP